MKRAVAVSLAFVTIGTSFGSAQEIHIPGPGSFAEFARQRLGTTSTELLTTLNRLGADLGTALDRPKSPVPHPMERLPANDPQTGEYGRQLTDFLERTDQLRQLTEQFDQQVRRKAQVKQLSGTARLPQFNYVAQKIGAWNGDIFWAPASKETDVNLRYADEVRAVFGPIPPFDVTQVGKRSKPDGSSIETAALYVEVDGNRVELKPNPSKPKNPLEFEHRDIAGNVVKWTSTIDKCDKPSLAGGVTPCGTASRLSRTERGNVEWIALARKTKGPEPLAAEQYWSQDDPSYALLGYIGFNRVSGEVAFFDGTYEGMRFSWKSPTIQPGGSGYQDEQGRALAARTYDATFRIDCASCHDNKEPHIITPYIKQARVGYRSRARADAFSLGHLLPELTRLAKTPYRVVGSAYTAVHKPTLDSGRTVADPGTNCTTCHGLTNHNTARFASDAVGRLGSLTGDEAIENNFRTDWALRTGEGKIHPWMLPEPDGNDLSSDPLPSPLGDADWDKLRRVLENPDSDPRSLKLYTEAPAPESVLIDDTRIGDPSGPQNFTINVANNRDGAAEPMAREIQVAWSYLNSLGGIPERDDVRFNIAVLEGDIPPNGAEPQLGDFPSIEQTKGVGASALNVGVYTDGSLLIVKDVSFVGHRRWTDPVGITAPRQYRVDFPAQKDRRYLIRMAAKRYTFDQSVEKLSNADHVFSVDVQ
jgi:hypothetical protein